MPRFYFPIVDGVQLDDLEGNEFPDLDAAKKDADLIALHMPKAIRGTLWSSVRATPSYTAACNQTEMTRSDPAGRRDATDHFPARIFKLIGNPSFAGHAIPFAD